MNNSIPTLIIHDLQFSEDTIEVRCYDHHVTIESTETYGSSDAKESQIRITPEKARQLATLLSDYCDKQGV